MDKRYLLAFGMGAASLALGILVVRLLGIGAGLPPLPPPPHHEPPPVERSQNLSGPYTHKNLTVYLVHGDEQLTGKAPLTLEEAMTKKLVIVHETSDVNELEVQNLSDTEEIFIQAGDIVKGGQQDRILSVDLLVPARSGRIPIASFCVEQGRWTARGAESMREFNSADQMAPSKDMKLAAKHTGSQGAVWRNVEESQAKLSAAANTNTASNVSRSSLPLTLENEEVRATASEYTTALRSIISGKEDVIGFVFAINGEINSADTYGSSELFTKLWPKLLRAASIEAVAESYEKRSSNEVTPESIREFMSEGESARIVQDRTITDRVTMITRESSDVVFFESQDRRHNDAWLHRNYLKN